MSKPKFTKSNKWPEFEDLQQKINSILQNSDSGNVHRKTLFAASILFIIFTFCIITKWAYATNLLLNVIATLLLGILTVPMVLVIGHEATHENFSTYKTINSVGQMVFYFLGTTPYFWELRHIHAHHPFTNIKKWDLDIEQSQAIRLDNSQEHHARHKYQPYYMPFLFIFYSLNWFLYVILRT